MDHQHSWNLQQNFNLLQLSIITDAKHICCRFLECRPPVSFSPMSHHWTLPTTPVSLTSPAQPPCIWLSPKVEYCSSMYWSTFLFWHISDNFGYALRSLSCAPSLSKTFFLLLGSLAFNALMLWWGSSEVNPDKPKWFVSLEKWTSMQWFESEVILILRKLCY